MSNFISIFSIGLAIFFAGCAGSNFAGSSGGTKKAKKQTASSESNNDEDSNDNAGDPDDEGEGEGDDNKNGDAKVEESEEEKKEKEALKALPKFAMLANHFECGFCHIKIYGDMVSTATVPPARADSEGSVIGNWLVNGTLNVGTNGAKIAVTGEKKENYTGKEVPKGGLPQIDFGTAKAKAKGSLTGNDAAGAKIDIKKTHSGNLVIVGTDASPITIKGDVVVDGDLIIKGRFKGIGTIYATGNIYVPFDLLAKNSPFPYDEGAEAAKKQGDKRAADDSYDGLALATPKTVFIGDADSSIIGHHEAGIDSEPEVDAMFAWYGKDKFKQLYGKAFDCNSAAATRDRSLNAVDAFLYAARSIEGFASGSGFSIRGGMITDRFLILNASNSCTSSTKTNPIHGRVMNNSYVEYDWRLATGKYRVLERLGDALKP